MENLARTKKSRATEAARDVQAGDQPPLLVLLLLLAVEPVVSLPELPLEDDGVLLLEPLAEPLPEEGWSLALLELLLEGELELGGVLDEDEEALLSLLFIARLPLEDEPEGLLGEDEAIPDEPEDPDELPDWERRESLPRSQADSPKVAASAAARAVRKNFLCSMSTIS